MRKTMLILTTFGLILALAGSVLAQQPPPPGGGNPPGTPPPRPGDGGNPPPRPGNNSDSGEPLDDSLTQVTLDITGYETFGNALADQITAGDGAGIDNTFRNSGVVIDEDANAYFAVNGVHPVQQGDYTSYYPKSIVMASLEDDTIMATYSFDSVNGHDVDMEALTYTEAEDMLYIGDEYNLIYELDLNSGEILREWDLADIGVSTSVDKGIEAMTYLADTGYFYAGIQDTGSVLVLDLGLDDGTTVTQIDEFQLVQGWAPSGLFAHADGTLWVVSMRGGGQAGEQMIFHYGTDGTPLCAITIPAELGMTRPDGIYIDSADEFIYIVDSQGPIYDGYSLYRIPWTNPC